MRFRWPIPAVTLCISLGAAHFGPAYPKQDYSTERDQKILQIQQLIQDHDLAEASRKILEAAKQYPADAGLDNLRGIVEAQQGNYAAAEKSFSRALKREPKFTGASLNLGRLYQENFAGDAQARRKALGVYLGVLAYDPKNAEANYQSAALLLEQGKYQDSLDRVSRLSEESQTGAQVLSIVCADYAGLGDRKQTDAAAARLLADANFSEADAQQALLGLRTGKRDGCNATREFGETSGVVAGAAARAGLGLRRSGQTGGGASGAGKIHHAGKPYSWFVTGVGAGRTQAERLSGRAGILGARARSGAEERGHTLLFWVGVHGLEPRRGSAEFLRESRADRA